MLTEPDRRALFPRRAVREGACPDRLVLEVRVPVLPRPVLDVPAAPPEEAREHFARLLAFETDCADVHAALQRRDPGFLLIDVRSPQRFAAGHVPDAVNLPHGRITERTLAALPTASLHVVYCSGPHCNGADRAALRLAQLGRPVKKMIGGITGWVDEGFSLHRPRVQ